MTLSAHFFTIPLPKFCLAHWNVYKPTSRLPGFTGTLSLPLSLSLCLCLCLCRSLCVRASDSPGTSASFQKPELSLSESGSALGHCVRRA